MFVGEDGYVTDNATEKSAKESINRPYPSSPTTRESSMPKAGS